MGQNLGHDEESWIDMIQTWFDEHMNYQEGIDGDGSKNGEPVKHYKQVWYFYWLLFAKHLGLHAKLIIDLQILFNKIYNVYLYNYINPKNQQNIFILKRK